MATDSFLFEHEGQERENWTWSVCSYSGYPFLGWGAGVRAFRCVRCSDVIVGFPMEHSQIIHYPWKKKTKTIWVLKKMFSSRFMRTKTLYSSDGTVGSLWSCLTSYSLFSTPVIIVCCLILWRRGMWGGGLFGKALEGDEKARDEERRRERILYCRTSCGLGEEV